MPSDVTYDLSAFSPENIPAHTLSMNKLLVQIGSEDVKWWEIGAAEFRRRRRAGETVFPAPVLLPHASEIQVPASDDPKRMISCRVFLPERGESKGVFYHVHGGGWVLSSADAQDLFLDHIMKSTGLTVVSVEYRLAPEHIFPAANNDCYDVADWLCTIGKEKYGPLKFIGGESAGGHLTAMVLLHLRSKNMLSTVKGAVLNYGAYDLSLLPSAALAGPEVPILYEVSTRMFLKAFLPNMNAEDRKDGKVSPLYNDLKGLGSALFIVGTEDCLMDDSVLMHFRWSKAGNEGVLKFVPGAPHGFMIFNGNVVESTKEGWKIMIDYIHERL